MVEMEKVVETEKVVEKEKVVKKAGKKEVKKTKVKEKNTFI